MEHKHSAIEQAIISVSSKISVVGGGAAVTGGTVGQVATDQAISSMAEYGVVCGIVVGVSSLAINGVVQFRRDRRDTKLHKAQIASLIKPETTSTSGG